MIRQLEPIYHEHCPEARTRRLRWLVSKLDSLYLINILPRRVFDTFSNKLIYWVALVVVYWIAKLAMDREDLSSNPSKLFIREPASVKLISYSILRKRIKDTYSFC